MATNTKNPSLWIIALHVLLTFATGGAWLVVLIIWFIFKMLKNN